MRRRQRELFLHLRAESGRWRKATSKGARTLVGLKDSPGIPVKSALESRRSQLLKETWRDLLGAEKVCRDSASRERCLEKCNVQILSLPFCVSTVPSGAARFEVFCTSFSCGEKKKLEKNVYLILLLFYLGAFLASTPLEGSVLYLDTRNCGTEGTAVLCGRAATLLLRVTWMCLDTKQPVLR